MSEKRSMRLHLEDIYQAFAADLLVELGYTKDAIDIPTTLAVNRWVDRRVSSVEKQLDLDAAPTEAAKSQPDLSLIPPAGRA